VGYPVLTAAGTRQSALRPSWLDSIVFLVLMSGPPKFRHRDMSASLAGAMDAVVLLHIGVWACGGLWVLARLYPSLLRRGSIPPLNNLQLLAAFLLASLSLSLWHSPGFLLTAFTLGQFAVMLAFAWVFVHRYGPSTYLRHLFAGVCLLGVLLIGTVLLTPELVIQIDQSRFRGERIVSTGAGALAALGFVLCLSKVPPLRPWMFWGSVVVFGALLVTSRMRTAYGALFAFLAVGWMFGRRLPVRMVLPMFLVLLGGLFALDMFAATTLYILRDQQTIETMNDRIPLWAYMSRIVMRDEPLIGFGYFAGSRVLAPQYNPGLGTAHSAFFEFLVGGGILGATLFVVLCAALVFYAARLIATHGHQPEALASAGLLTIALVLGLTSSEATLPGPVGFCFWSMTAVLPALYRSAVSRSVVMTRRVTTAVAPHMATHPSS
jgi:hypothetical protein